MAEQSLALYSDLIAVASGIFFWVAFLIFGFIARRYSVVFNKNTFHWLMMLAPSGILLYSLLLIVKKSMISNAGLSEVVQFAAYIFLFLSAALCLLAVFNFNRLIDSLIKYKGKDK